MDAMLERKLREMLDRHEIWQVMQRYARGLDRMDRELVRSCYFDDAIEDHSHFVGTAEGFFEWADQVSLQYKWCLHGLMNHHCELDGDNAHCETYFQFTGFSAKPPHLLSMGRYVDHFQRRNGEWRIANRATVVEGTFELYDRDFAPNAPSSYSKAEAQPSTRDRNDVSYQRPVRPRAPRPMRRHT